MSTKNSVLGLAQRLAKQLVAEQTQARIMLGFDAAIMAAHEVFNMGPGRAAAFSAAYHEAMEELAGMYIDDADENGDHHMEYAKAKRDAAIRRIVGEENFVEFDRAYGAAYMDELMRIRVSQRAAEAAAKKGETV